MKKEIACSEQYSRWFSGLRDRTIKNRILARLARVENGNFGDCSRISENLYELRFFFGGGLRIYYTMRGEKVVLLLAGGDKSTQAEDIEKAESILHEQEE